jgi:predicted Zn-dependent protease
MKKDRANKLKGLIWVIAACVIGMFFAVGISPLAHAIPWGWEKKLGAAISMPKAECRYNSRAEVLLQHLVKRLYPVYPDDNHFSIEVKVAQDPVVNAYATLGGKIFINSGLLKEAQSPEEVAGVIAHEIEHVHSRHIMEGALVHLFTSEGISVIFGKAPSAGFARYLLNMNFTRGQETQADEGGLRRLQAAKVDNKGFKNFFERMEKEGSALVFLSDHPDNKARMEMAGQYTVKNPNPIMNREEWDELRNYCGGK